MAKKKDMMRLALGLACLSLASASCNEPTNPTSSMRAQGLSAEKGGISERARREGMLRQHFADMRARLDIVTTTKTSKGQTIDWIRPESQLAPGAELATPPDLPVRAPINPPDDAALAHRDSRLPAAREPVAPPVELVAEPAPADLSIEADARGPEGTVPVLQFDIEGYLQRTAELPARIEQFKPFPDPSPNAAGHYYVWLWSNAVANHGTAGRINSWDAEGPLSGTGPATSDQSIMQSVVFAGTPQQTVEAGLIESLNGQNPAGDSRPYLFVYFTTNNYASTGNNVGGFNQSVTGWVQVSSTIVPGLSVSSPTSSTNGTQYEVELRTLLFQGNWWVLAVNQWIGYYPASIFSTSGLRNGAQGFSWYGEVYDDSAPTSTNTDMGSGAFAAGQWGQAAFIRNVYYIDTSDVSTWAPINLYTPTDAACYSRDGPVTVAGGGNIGYLGGPGRQAAGCL